MKASSSASELVMNSCLDSEEAEEPSIENRSYFWPVNPALASSSHRGITSYIKPPLPIPGHPSISAVDMFTLS